MGCVPGRPTATISASTSCRRSRDDGVVSALAEGAPGLWRFTVARNGLPPTMTAYALRDGEDTILVDPLVAGETEPLLAALDQIVCGRVRILVTTPFHVRGSEFLWRRWRDRHEVTIFGHELCATWLGDRSAFRPLRGGETLDGGVRAHPIGRPRRAEIPFELPSRAGAARRRPRAGGEPDTASMAQIVAVLIAGPGQGPASDALSRGERC